MWRLRLSAARTGRSQRESGRCPAARGPQPGWLSSRGGGGSSSGRRCGPPRSPACGVRAAAARLRVAHRLLLRARRPSFHRASRGLAGSARRAFRLMCLLDTFRTPSPCRHVPLALALPQAWCCDSISGVVEFRHHELQVSRLCILEGPSGHRAASRRSSRRHVCAQLGHLGRLCCRRRQRHATPARCRTSSPPPGRALLAKAVPTTGRISASGHRRRR